MPGITGIFARGVRYAVAALALAGLAACGGPASGIIGVDGVAPSAAEVPLAKPVDIYIATSRADADDPGILFSGERSPDISFARVRVFVPPEREIGQVNRAQTLPPDPRRHFVVLDPVRFDDGPAFVRAVDSEIGSGPTRRSVLVFVHGFNTDMPSAIVRTAQFVHDSGYTGVPILFSWPSRGRATSYVYDINSALQSRDALVGTARLLSTTKAKGFDLVAHSMGNLVVMEALRQLALTGELGSKNRVSNVILASPDVDLDLFERQLETFAIDRKRVYIMVASNDRALALSRTIAGGVSRVGNADPETLAKFGVTVVDVSSVRDGDWTQHSQFASAPGIVQLIGTHISRTGALAGEEEDVSLRSAIVQATLLPARIVGGGRVLVVDD